jgi:DNA-binding NtrC family response regulator
MPTLETADDSDDRGSRQARRTVAGMIVVFCAGRAAMQPRALGSGGLVVGRKTRRGLDVTDDRVSREHVRVERSARCWKITDLGSHNGTFVDGERIEGTIEADAPRVLRMGQTVLLFAEDVTPRIGGEIATDDGVVIGPSMRAALDAIVRAARAKQSVLVVGESGTGKELAAHTYHRAAAPDGPRVDVNCAAIPATVAERLLFGAKKGAYSGASGDAVGYAQAADHGVLFLDEIGELELEVQAKLLRFLETGEVMPLGAATPRIVDVQILSATNRDLPARAAEGKFRPDLLYRLARTQTTLPPLRERPEEIPWLVELELRQLGEDAPTPTARFVEACLLRSWPGNVRELRAAVRTAADTARAIGEATIGADELPPRAGIALREDANAAPRPRLTSEPPPGPERDHPLREAIVTAMQRHDGNLMAVARTLGMHRTQLYRLLKKLGLGSD